MPATFTPISKEEMHSFLVEQGFREILSLTAQCGEAVYGKILCKNVCLRVYTSISGSISRDNGSDAIRVCVVKRTQLNKIVGIGKTKRVNRTQGWKKNLQQRIDNFMEQFK